MDEEDAADALAVMNQRFYDGRQMQVEYSPVQNFQEVRGGNHILLGILCVFIHSFTHSLRPSVSFRRFSSFGRQHIKARCRDYDEENCARGGFCNFMHVKPVPLALIRNLEEDASEERRRQRRVKSNDKPSSHGSSSGHKRSRRGDADSVSHHSSASSSSEASSVSRSKRRKKHHHHHRRSSSSRGNHKSSRRSRSGSNSS